MYCRNCGETVSDQAVLCVKCGTPPLGGNHYCPNCGVETPENAVVCIKCGVSLERKSHKAVDGEVGDKKWLTALLLCIFLGGLGVHNFYAGRTGVGAGQLVLWLVGFFLFFFAIGIFLWIGLAVWVIIDLVAIISGNFKDGQGRLLQKD